MTPFLLWHLLQASAQRTPDQIAVIDRARSITYRTLDERSTQLARALRGEGVGAGDRIGIFLDKSLEAVIAIFGVLKAGAAYVPLDATSPLRRVALIVQDCQLAGLVSDAGKAAALWPVLDSPPPRLILAGAGENGSPVPPAATLVFWSEVFSGSAGVLPDTHTIESDLAYILYTSGSTGRPKGVAISHRASMTFVHWATDYFQIQRDDRLSSHAPLHFDLSIFDIFAGLAAGATVALVPPETAIFPYTLAEWMAEQRITVWYSVPTALTQLVLHGELDSHDLAALRLILFAGEAFPVKHVRSLQKLLPGVAYYNLYGPTETNVCTVYPVPPLPDTQTAPCPIGVACANMQVFALDDGGNPIVTGQEGELYVRGPGLMRGYWNAPDASAQALVPHPLRPESGEWVYRTGDWVRLEVDGNYSFIGRRDGMVKSRGYRIELGEIETALYRHPAVAEAAVVLVPDEEIGNRLLAFVVTTPGQAVGPVELLAHCRAVLPHYMLPERVDIRTDLPKTSTGKIDRRALEREKHGQ